MIWENAVLCGELRFLTTNKNKLTEAERILKPYGIAIKPCREYQKVEIQTDYPREVVEFAAKQILTFRKLMPFAYDDKLPCIVIEDFGFYIDALNGFPGLYAHQVYDMIGNKGVLKLLGGERNRRARYVVAVALLYTDRRGRETYKIFEAVTEGTVSPEERGINGFAYDRIFIPLGEERTFAEMTPEEKDKYSPRAKALRVLARFITSFGSETSLFKSKEEEPF